MFPPSLLPAVQARAFQASNGELGVPPQDVSAFLDACEADGLKVLGWELWIIDHEWGIEPNAPIPSPSSWCGGIPLLGYDVPAVVGGEGGVEDTRKQIAATNLAAEVQPEWLNYVRFNFTLGD